MDVTEKIMAVCLFLDEVDDETAVLEFIAALESGIDAGEVDALAFLEGVRQRVATGPLPTGVLGDIIRLMKSKQRLDHLFARMEMQTAIIRSISSLLSGRADNTLQAKITVKKIENVLQLKGDLRCKAS
jgi:hypothetical protein